MVRRGNWQWAHTTSQSEHSHNGVYQEEFTNFESSSPFFLKPKVDLLRSKHLTCKARIEIWPTHTPTHTHILTHIHSPGVHKAAEWCWWGCPYISYTSFHCHCSPDCTSLAVSSLCEPPPGLCAFGSYRPPQMGPAEIGRKGRGGERRGRKRKEEERRWKRERTWQLADWTEEASYILVKRNHLFSYLSFTVLHI